RLLPFAVFALLAAATKEEIALVVAGFGVWYALARRRPGTGTAIVAAGALWFGLAVGVVVPHFNHGGASSLYSRYREVGGPRGGSRGAAASGRSRSPCSRSGWRSSRTSGSARCSGRRRSSRGTTGSPRTRSASFPATPS